MAFKINPTSSTSILYKIYASLRDKNRTPEEDYIFQMIFDQYGKEFNESSTYYYKENEHKAKVSYSGFYSRINKGWSWDDALTTPPVKDNPYNRNRPKGKTAQQIEIEERENDITLMIKNNIPLTRRQKEYIEENPVFAARLKAGA